MKMVFKSAAICAALLLTACGGGGGGDTASKDLFSVWTRDQGGGRLDFTTGGFSTPFRLAQFYADGSQCECVIRAFGDQASGTFVINQCYYVRGSSSKDPGCTASNGSGTYTNVNALLTVTGPTGQAVTYR